MAKVFSEVVAQGVKLDKLQVTGHDLTDFFPTKSMVVSLVRTAPAIPLNQQEKAEEEVFSFDADDLQAVIDSLTKLQNTFKKVEFEREQEELKIQERKDISERTRQIHLLMNDIKAEQEEKTHWLHNIFYSHHTKYMCLTTHSHQHCFINVDEITASNTVNIHLEMQITNGEEELKTVTISFDDMQKAFIDLDSAINSLFEKSKEIA